MLNLGGYRGGTDDADRKVMRCRLMVSAEGQRDEDRGKGPAGHDEASERAVPGRRPHGEVPAGRVPALALVRVSGSIALSSFGHGDSLVIDRCGPLASRRWHDDRIRGERSRPWKSLAAPRSPRARARSGSPSAKIPFALIGRALASYDATRAYHRGACRQHRANLASARDDAHGPGRLPGRRRGAARTVAGADAGDESGTGGRLDRAR